jgi:hypothetical protein
MFLKLLKCFQKRVNLKITTKENTLKIQYNLKSFFKCISPTQTTALINHH